MSLLVLVSLPSLIVLEIGWFLVLVGFSKIHQDEVVESANHIDAGSYASSFLQFWVFMIGVPPLCFFVLLHAAMETDNYLLGIIIRLALCSSVAAVGGCLVYTSNVINTERRLHYVNPLSEYHYICLSGELISLICLLLIFGGLPWITGKVRAPEYSTVGL